VYTLLIADDEHLERDAIELLVKKSRLDIQTLKARHGREAVEIVQSTHVDIAFLDIRMPGLTGLEAAKRITEIAPECRIVFLTAWNSFDFAQEALRLGAKDYLVKPASRNEVIALLERLIGELDRKQKGSQEAQEVREIRSILKQFNRSFFASLKYGLVPIETMHTYFSIEGIEETSGLALVCDNLDERDLVHMLQGATRQSTPYQACYFPTVDRTSILLFSSNPELLVHMLTEKQLQATCPTCHVGVGRPFSDYQEIPKAIREASQAYLVSIRSNRSQVFFDDREQLENLATHEELESTERELVQAVLDADVERARRYAHQVQDLITLRYDPDDTAILDKFYESVLVMTRTIRAGIDHFTYEPLQKTSLIEIERYCMDFIDSACETIMLDRQDKYVRIFREVDAYMNSHYSEPLSLEQMSELFGISPNYFSRLFKQYLGTSFIDHLTACRMRVAKQMIRTGMKITEVAQLTGFSDYSYFSRVFRNVEGLSPREFQKNCTIL